MNERKLVIEVLGEAGEDAIDEHLFFARHGCHLAREGALHKAEVAFHCASEAARRIFGVGDFLQQELKRQGWFPRRERYTSKTAYLKRKALVFQAQALINADRLGSSRPLFGD